MNSRLVNSLCLGILLVLTLVWGRFFLADHVIGGTPDMAFAFAKSAAVLQSWHDGFILGRWSLDLNFGYGYPLLNFYSPLFFYMAAAIGSFLSNNIAYGVNLTILIAAFLSVVTMYFYVRRWWGAEGALLASILYLFAPYRSLDIYHRGGCAEFLVFLFLPLLLLTMERFFHKPKFMSFLALVLSMAGLILSHNLMAMLILPFAFVYAGFLIFLYPERSMVKGFFIAGALVYAFFLTAYFWLPSFAEIKFTQVEKLLTGWGDYKLHFMTLQQIFFASGLREAYHGGLLWSLLTGMALCLTPLMFRRDKILFKVMIFWGVILAVCVFFMTAASGGVWSVLKPLSFVQFPWRFFLFLAFMSSFLIAAIIYALPQNRRWYAVVVLAAVVILSHYRYTHPADGTYMEDTRDLKAWVYTHHPMDAMEALPRQVKVVSPVAPDTLLKVVRGDARLSGAPVRPAARYHFQAHSTGGAMLVLHHYYFPGWNVLVDGRKAQIFADNPLGVIVFMVPPGEHQVDIFFGHTPVRWVGEILSWLALAGLLGLWAWSSEALRKRWFKLSSL